MNKNPTAHRWRTAILIALFAIFIYGLVAHATTLWDRDEPRFARATVEMLSSGEWMIPTFNGNLRPDKPILIYWLMAPFIKLLGPTALAARCASILGVAGAMLMTYWIGNRLMDARMGIMAMIALGTAPLALAEGTLATADGSLLFWITASMAVICSWMFPDENSDKAQENSTKNAIKHTWLLGVCLGGAQLIKGPVGLAIPLIALVLMFIIQRWAVQKKAPDPFITADKKGADKKGSGAFFQTWRWWMIIAACVLGTVFFLVWAIPANNATNGAFFNLGFRRHVMDRTMRPLEGHGGNWFLTLPFYLPVIIVGFFPWTLFILGAMAVAWQEIRAGSRAMIFLASWALAAFLLMTCVSTKLPHYVLPMWPAMALMVAWTLRWCEEKQLSDSQQKWLHRGGILFAPVAIGAAGVCLSLRYVIFRVADQHTSSIAKSIGIAGVAMALLIAAMAFRVLRSHLKYSFISAATQASLYMTVLLFFMALFFLPTLESLKPVPRMAQQLRKRIDPEIPVYCFGFFEPSLVYYLDDGVVKSPPLSELITWYSQGNPGYVVTLESSFSTLQEALKLSPKNIVARERGINYSNGKTFTLIALNAVHHGPENPQDDAPAKSAPAPATQESPTTNP